MVLCIKTLVKPGAITISSYRTWTTKNGAKSIGGNIHGHSLARLGPLRHMNRYRDRRNKLVTNSYIKLEYVKDIQALKDITKYEPVSSNITDFSLFCDDLLEYEEQGTSKRKNTSSNYGVLITFMLNNEAMAKGEVLDNLIDHIVSRYGQLPYYAYVVQRGKGYYLVMYMCERYYNHEGLDIIIKAKKDSYKNKKTGKACLENDKDAYLYRQEGEIISHTVSKFTSKQRYFRFGNTSSFLKYMSYLKNWFMDICENVLKVAINKGISFKRFVVERAKNKGIARLYNDALIDFERIYDNAFSTLEAISDSLSGDIERHDRHELEDLYTLYNTKIKEGQGFKVKTSSSRTFSYCFSLDNDYKTASDTIKAVKELFKSEIESLIQRKTGEGVLIHE